MYALYARPLALRRMALVDRPCVGLEKVRDIVNNGKGESWTRAFLCNELGGSVVVSGPLESSARHGTT